MNLSPDDVLAALVANVRPQKRKNLEALHKACAEVYKVGGTDFSYATIGRIAESRGGAAAKTIYNSQSADYRALVDSWKKLSIDSRPQPVSRSSTVSDAELLRRVPEPDVRALLGAALAERNKLRAQLNMLKSQANVVIDRRPLPGSLGTSSGGDVVQVLTTADQLLPTERDAMIAALASDFLAQEGWTEGPHGEVTNARGRIIFKAGYATGVRRLLGIEKS